MSEGRRYRFRPGLVPSLVAFAIIAGTLALGIWQLERRAWKNDLLAKIEENIAAMPTDLPQKIVNPGDWDYKRVFVAGTFSHDRELHLYRSHEDHGPGYHILTPLIRDEGAPILVNRGWVPPELKSPQEREAGRIGGRVSLAGIARRPEQGGWLMPPNDPVANEWLSIDLDAMAKATGLDLAPLVIYAGESPNPGGYPLGGQLRIDIPNNHLIYAIQWFALALSALIIFVIFGLKRR